MASLAEAPHKFYINQCEVMNTHKETRDKKQKTRDKRQETRDKRQRDKGTRG